MRAYLAVIKDAFRAAIAAKLLYVMLALIIVFLLVLAPISYNESLSSQLRTDHIRNVSSIADRLYVASESEPTYSDAYLWSKVSSRTQEMVNNYVNPSEDSDAPGQQLNRINELDYLRDSLFRDLRDIIDDQEFYNAEALSDIELDEEAQALVDKGVARLDEEQYRRLNRLILDAMFPMELTKVSDSMIRFTYLGFELPFEGFVFSHRELDMFSKFTIPWILDKLLLSIGVLIAILFTANMVPEMLEPGSLNLLLSKPVRRWGLFLSKYLGACAFSLLNASLLFIGLWLILGARLGLWNIAFLMCIPIYVFVFGIYYSVSALVGLMYRSAILSVVAAILFWAFCFVLGVSQSFIGGILESSEPARVVVDGGHIVKTDRENRAALLSEADRSWESAFRPADVEALGWIGGIMPSTPILGLSFDEEGERFLGAQVPFGELGSPFSTNRYVVTANEENSWAPQTKMKAPAFTRAIFHDVEDRSLVFVTYFGKIYRLPLDQIDAFDEASKDETKDVVQPTTTEVTSANSAPDDLSYFTEVSPEIPIPSEQIELIAWDEKTRKIAFYGNGRLAILHWNGERYDLNDKDRYGLPNEAPGAALALNGEQAFIGVRNEALFQVDLESGTVTELPWPTIDWINSILTDPEGARTVILDTKGDVWQLVEGTEKVVRLNVHGQGKIRALSPGDDGKFWTIDAYSRVYAYSWADGKQVESAPTSMGTFQRLYNYGIYPLYWVSPKPGEFYRVVTHMANLAGEEVTDEETSEVDVVQRDAVRNNQVRQRRSPWLPVWNGLGFIAVMLFISVWYFERQDF